MIWKYILNLIQSSFESEKFRQINECQKISLLRRNHTGFEKVWCTYYENYLKHMPMDNWTSGIFHHFCPMFLLQLFTASGGLMHTRSRRSKNTTEQKLSSDPLSSAFFMLSVSFWNDMQIAVLRGADTALGHFAFVALFKGFGVFNRIF